MTIMKPCIFCDKGSFLLLSSQFYTIRQLSKQISFSVLNERRRGGAEWAGWRFGPLVGTKKQITFQVEIKIESHILLPLSLSLSRVYNSTQI